MEVSPSRMHGTGCRSGACVRLSMVAFSVPSRDYEFVILASGRRSGGERRPHAFARLKPAERDGSPTGGPQGIRELTGTRSGGQL